MESTRKVLPRIVCGLVLCASLCAQRADRGIITGVVSDPNGMSASDSTVAIRNEGTGVEAVLKTNEAGVYISAPLVLGTYTVTVTHAGFKTFVRTGLLLGSGQEIRQDAVLELGALTEKVTVTATPDMINVEQPDITRTIDEKYYHDLPVVMGADIRLAESMLQVQPGFLPMKPNGDPMFRGSQFNSRINGGQTMATENFFDGAAFGYASGHQQSHESAPSVEAVKEMRVISNTYSAQYGHTSGGFIEYTSKSGTNSLHGNLYEYFANDALNARGFFPATVTKARNNAFGFTAGGPVEIPKIYHGKNKTFFFTNWDYLKFRSGVLPGFGNTTPTDAFKQGDFSSRLTSTVAGTDALGRTIYQGQIFNPATTRLVNGVSVRDPYQGNIIPASDTLRSQVAAKISGLLAHPDRAGTNFNVAGNPSGDQTWVLNARTLTFRVDHNFSDRFSMSHSFYWNHRPAIRNCGEPLGCNTSFNGETSPEKNNDYYGVGFYQRIATQHAHQQFNYVISNSLVNHTTIAFDRWFMGGNPLAGGVGWPTQLWGSNKGGLLDQTAGPPAINFSGNIPYNGVGMNWQRFGFETNNRWQFSDDLSWIKGRHSFKMGFEYRLHQFNSDGWAQSTGGTFNFNNLETGGYDALGNNISSTGESFASFLLGQTHDANQNIPVYPVFSERYFAPWVNDEIKVTNRLTVTVGLRFDYQTPRTERHNRYSTFDPTVPNPGAGGRLGALVFAGVNGQGNTFETPPKDAFGPRAGFAYRIGGKSVVRGGYGMYYGGVAFSQFIGAPTIGFQANPTAPNLTNGRQPAFYLDSGFPQNLIVRPPFVDPTFANGTAPLAIDRTGSLTLPRFQNYSLTFERQITSNMKVDLSYIGNHGTRLVHTFQTLGTVANMNDPKILALGASVLNADINSSTAKIAGIALPYTGFVGNVAQALRAYPQYQSIQYRNVPTGKSVYQAFEAVVEQRFSHGLQFRVGYTYSRLNNDGAESGQAGNGVNAGIQNPVNTQAGEWGLSADDVPHVLVVAYTWEVPFAKSSSSRALKLVAGGWNLSGALHYETGRPLNIFMNNNLGGFLFNGQKRPNRVASSSGVADNGKFDPNSERYLSLSGWTDPGPLQFGNAPRHDGTVRGFATYAEDLSLFKYFPVNETAKFKLEGQFGNVFNRVGFCDPNTNWSAGTGFGQVGTQCNQPRSVQLGLRFDF